MPEGAISGQGDVLDRKRIRFLFGRLDEKMHEAGVEASIFVVGGAAVALTLNERRVTNDIDGKYENPELDPLIHAMAQEEGLSSQWLNHSINTVLSYFREDDEPKTLFVGKNLTIQVASPEYVLAMKLAARREKDVRDVVLLVNKLGIASREELIKVVMRYFKADLSAVAHQRQLIEEFIDLIIEERLLEFPDSFSAFES
ncbi:MAG: hypothetical protein LBK67_06030 [Coriobacteriales bacterium]|jgi:BioD-like phosphotransacetylase family protein|nr:hypothetical protein [Coriobacteriales bacterium]